MMDAPAVTIRFDDNGRAYCPGETLAGDYRFKSISPAELKAVEVSVLWYTEGKGDEDMAVHEFWRWDAEAGDALDAQRPGRFATSLPPSPLSYNGMVIKLRWCVRVRAFLQHGKEVFGQRDFQLGNVPSLKAQPS